MAKPDPATVRYTVLGTIFTFGALITAVPLDQLGLKGLDWYPALAGITMMCLSATAAILNMGTGTLSERVEQNRMLLGSLVIATFFLLGLTFAWESRVIEDDPVSSEWNLAFDGMGPNDADGNATLNQDVGPGAGRETKSALEGVGIMGVLVLMGMLLGGNLLSDERRLTGAEVRTAIAVAVIAVFFGVLATGANEELVQNSILQETFANFWKVLIAVVGFYFGSLAVEKVASQFNSDSS